MNITGSVLITDHALQRFRERVSQGVVHNEFGIIRAMIDQANEVKHLGALAPYGVRRMYLTSIYLIAQYNGKHRLKVLLILRDDGLGDGLAVVTIRTKGERG